MGVGNYITNH